MRHFIALDTETPPFDDAILSPGGRSRIEPFVTPPMVLLSYATLTGAEGLLPPESAEEAIRGWVAGGLDLVFHNAPFDVRVILKQAPALKPLIIQLVEEGRLHDTQNLEQLIQIARGAYTSEGQRVRLYTLEELAKRRCNITLDKDDNIRLTFGDYLGRFHKLPAAHKAYAIADPKATALVFKSQWAEAEILAKPANCRYPIYPDATDRFGPLTNNIQSKGALALDFLEGFPVRVNVEKANALDARLTEESTRLQAVLIEWGFASRTRGGKFSIKQKHIRGLLKDWSDANGISYPVSDSGGVSLDYTHWSQVLPRLSPERAAAPETLTSLEDRISVWMRFNRIRRTLSTYLSQYKYAETHYPSYYNIGARTGRTSARRPSVHQIPKRRGESLREIFVPAPGTVILEADYSAAELHAIAAIWDQMFGGSLLSKALATGSDPHVEKARIVFKDFDTLPPDEKEKRRQLMKALAYGLPGGMGVKRLVASLKKEGITMSHADARSLRFAFIDAEPSLKAYLRSNDNEEAILAQAAESLGIPIESLYDAFDAWRDGEDSTPHVDLAFNRFRKWLRGDPRFTLPLPEGFDPQRDLFVETTATLTGRVRGRTYYSEARNTPFQGLIGDALKLSLWEMYKAWDRRGTWTPLAQIHDSILISTTDYKKDAQLLADWMKTGSNLALGRTIPVDVTLFEHDWSHGEKLKA